jgi:hypothetical protein
LIALAFVVAAPDARAESLAPIDAEDPAFAAATRAAPPKLVWHAEIARDEYRGNREMIGKPQLRTGYHGLVLPGDGRALAAIFERETADLLTGPVTPGSEALFYRAIDAAGRIGERIPIAAAADFGMLVDRGKGAAAVLGAGRDGTVPLFLVGAAGQAPRMVPLALPFAPIQFAAAGSGYLVWLDLGPHRQQTKRPFHLVRLDAEGRIVWTFAYPRDHYGFLAAATRVDGFTLAVLNAASLDGIVAPVISLLIDPAGKTVAKQTLDLRGGGGPVPTGLHALRGGGFLLTGFWWGPGGNFVAWLNAEGKLLRYADVTLGGFVEVQWIVPVGDGGFLGTDDKGQLLRFDRDAKLLWRGARSSPAAREISVHDLRALAGNDVLLAGSWGDDDKTKPGEPYATRYFVERWRFEW